MQKEKIKILKEIYPVFSQVYYSRCRKDRMEGTKKHPFHCLMSATLPTASGEYTSFHVEDGKSMQTSSWDTNMYKIHFHSEKINVQIFNRYYVGIDLPVEINGELFEVEKNKFGIKTARLWRLRGDFVIVDL